MSPSFRPSLTVAGVDGRLVQRRKLRGGDEAGGVLVRRLDHLDRLERRVGSVVAGRAGDDAVEVRRIALRFHERLPAAARTAVEVRDARSGAVERPDRGLPLHRGLVHGPVAEIDQPLGMANREAGVGARVPGVARRGGITATQRVGQRGVLDRTTPRTIANLEVLAVPARHRQPDFGPDVGIGRGLDRQRYAAEGRQVRRSPRHRRAALWRRECPGGHRPRGRHGGIRELQRGRQPLTRSGRDRFLRVDGEGQ